jgi:hypothetical protein
VRLWFSLTRAAGAIDQGSVPVITSEQVRAARALLRWDEQGLAEATKLPLATIARLEATPGPLAAEPSAIAALRTALEAAGIDLLEEDGGGMGVWLKKPNGEPIPLEELNASNDE